MCVYDIYGIQGTGKCIFMIEGMPGKAARFDRWDVRNWKVYVHDTFMVHDMS